MRRSIAESHCHRQKAIFLDYHPCIEFLEPVKDPEREFFGLTDLKELAAIASYFAGSKNKCWNEWDKALERTKARMVDLMDSIVWFDSSPLAVC